MTLSTAIQLCCKSDDVPDPHSVRKWADAAFSKVASDDAEVTIRIVDEEEARELNRKYRNKDSATNVLSFAYSDDPYAQASLLGDVVVCAPVLRREASSQAKSIDAHWAHIVVHGILHLCGYDHDRERSALHMQHLETEILAELGFPAPYN